MFSYESLEIWQLAIDYAKFVYKVTHDFPESEKYGLSNQLRRASVSISANIAEGSGAVTIKDKLNYLDVAIKSALETTSEIELAFQLDYLNKIDRDYLIVSAEIIIKKIRTFKKFIQNHKQLTINN